MERLNPPLLASIGTTHPWNIAGTGLDARVAAEYGLRHAAAVAAVSAQDAGGVHALHAVPGDVVRAQLESLPPGVAAFRIGALVSAETVRAVALFLRERGSGRPVVLDPVMAASLGGELRSGEGLAAALLAELVPLGAIVTPNTVEAEALLGVAVRDAAGLAAAGQRFVDLGARAAYVKGGHLAGEPVDVLVTSSGTTELRGARIAGSMRGGGCTLAAALACELALDRDLREAAAAAHDYVRAKIASGATMGGLQVAF